jgi:hypothetical protein
MVARWLVSGSVTALIALTTSGCAGDGLAGQGATTTTTTAAADGPLSVHQDGDSVVLRLTNPSPRDAVFWAYIDVWEGDAMLGRIGFYEGSDEFGFVPGVFNTQNDAGVTVPGNGHRDMTIPLPVELVGRPLVLTGRGLRHEVTLIPAAE